MASIEELQKVAKRLRVHSLKMTSQAGSGHPTTCLSMAEIMAYLFFEEMQYNIQDPKDYNNDEFVLSKGHAAPILWAAYAEAGIISQDDLLNLRKIDSPLEGHPTPRMEWVKSATGSLGQGLSVGVGLALAMKLDGSNRNCYIVLGDGECAEGNVWEAANSAAYFKLDNIYAVVDVNRLGQSDETMHGHEIEAYAKKFKAFGWHVIIIDGHSVDQIKEAFEKAHGSDKPTAIVAKTFKGNGISFLKDRNGWHGKPLDEEKLEEALYELSPVPEIDSKNLVKKPLSKKPPEIKRSFQIEIPDYSADKEVATRSAYGHTLVALGKANEAVVAIDGDVKNSTNQEGFFKAFSERSFESYIAEQNMVGMAIGLSARGFLPFVSTFACFLTRAHDQIRMAALSQANIKLCGSHVGVSIGADGPSQMGLEDIAMIRPIPGSLIFYTADSYSTVECTRIMAEYDGISFLRTTRSKTPILYSPQEKFKIGGSKIVKKSSDDSVTIIAAGITVHNSVEAYEELKKDNINIRIIDAYSVKPLDVDTVKESISETDNNVIVVEDNYPEGSIGEAVRAEINLPLNMIHLAVRELPRSGSPENLMKKYRIDSSAIIEAVKELIEK